MSIHQNKLRRRRSSLIFKPTSKIYLFDLDNTLFDANRSTFPVIEQLMLRYLTSVESEKRESASDKMQRYLQQYGATVKGLIVEHGIEPSDFLEKTHPVGALMKGIEQDLSLRRKLLKFKGHRVLISDGPTHYVHAALKALGVAHLFSTVLGIETFKYICKSDVEYFKRLLSMLKCAARRAVYLDDRKTCIFAARKSRIRAYHIRQSSKLRHR